MSLTPKQHKEVVNAYLAFIPMIPLAAKYGISRHGIWKILQRAGVDTSKRKLAVICYACGKKVMKTKGQIRRTKHYYCDMDCYGAALAAGNGYPYLSNRQGQRRARNLVSKYLDLGSKMVVHHENRDCLDNRLSNLRVFKKNGDHTRYHRGVNPVAPIWDGRNI